MEQPVECPQRILAKYEHITLGAEAFVRSKIREIFDKNFRE